MGRHASFESVLNLDAESQRALLKRGDEVERVWSARAPSLLKNWADGMFC